jgi:hypothetical protein
LDRYTDRQDPQQHVDKVLQSIWQQIKSKHCIRIKYYKFLFRLPVCLLNLIDNFAFTQSDFCIIPYGDTFYYDRECRDFFFRPILEPLRLNSWSQVVAQLKPT